MLSISQFKGITAGFLVFKEKKRFNLSAPEVINYFIPFLYDIKIFFCSGSGGQQQGKVDLFRYYYINC